MPNPLSKHRKVIQELWQKEQKNSQRIFNLAKFKLITSPATFIKKKNEIILLDHFYWDYDSAEQLMLVSHSFPNIEDNDISSIYPVMMIETTSGFKDKVNLEATSSEFKPFWKEWNGVKIFYAWVGAYSEEDSGKDPVVYTSFPLYFTVKLIIKNPKLWEKIKLKNHSPLVN